MRNELQLKYDIECLLSGTSGLGHSISINIGHFAILVMSLRWAWLLLTKYLKGYAMYNNILLIKEGSPLRSYLMTDKIIYPCLSPYFWWWLMGYFCSWLIKPFLMPAWSTATGSMTLQSGEGLVSCLSPLRISDLQSNLLLPTTYCNIRNKKKGIPKGC